MRSNNNLKIKFYYIIKFSSLIYCQFTFYLYVIIIYNLRKKMFLTKYFSEFYIEKWKYCHSPPGNSISGCNTTLTTLLAISMM
jgi:hypothetical protein